MSRKDYKVLHSSLEELLSHSPFAGTPQWKLFSAIILKAAEDLYSYEEPEYVKIDALAYLRSDRFKMHLCFLGVDYYRFKKSKLGL